MQHGQGPCNKQPPRCQQIVHAKAHSCPWTQLQSAILGNDKTPADRQAAAPWCPPEATPARYACYRMCERLGSAIHTGLPRAQWHSKEPATQHMKHGIQFNMQYTLTAEIETGSQGTTHSRGCRVRPCPPAASREHMPTDNGGQCEYGMPPTCASYASIGWPLQAMMIMV